MQQQAVDVSGLFLYGGKKIHHPKIVTAKLGSTSPLWAVRIIILESIVHTKMFKLPARDHNHVGEQNRVHVDVCIIMSCT